MSKPTHVAYVVLEIRENGIKKPIWRRVGSVFPHGKGNGFDVVIDEQLSVTGRIVCREPLPKGEEQVTE